MDREGQKMLRYQRIHDDRNGWTRRSLADGRAAGSRVKHKRKKSWAAAVQLAGRSAGGFVPFTEKNETIEMDWKFLDLTDDEQHCQMVILRWPWWLAGSHFTECTSNRPDIRFFTMTRLGNYFGCHPIGSTWMKGNYKRSLQKSRVISWPTSHRSEDLSHRMRILIFLQSLRAAEVDQFDISIDVEHDILALDISVIRRTRRFSTREGSGIQWLTNRCTTPFSWR